MSSAKEAAWLRAKIVGAFDDALIEYCTDLQTLVDSGEATAEDISNTIADAFPFEDAIGDAWREWCEEAEWSA